MKRHDIARVEKAFQRYLARSSIDAIRRADGWFADLNLSSPTVGVRVADLLLPQWRQAAVAGVAFYRLLAALETGRTVDSPLVRGRVREVLMGDLVADFEKATGERLLGFESLRSVKVKADPGLDSTVLRKAFEADREHARFLLNKRFEALRDGKREGWDSDRGYVAGVAQQVVAGGARGLADALGSADAKCKGWVRVSTTGRPCAFCAMLMSRGFVYRSDKSATGTKSYHPHCKCVARPIFSSSQFADPAYEANRQFLKDWYEAGGTVKDFRALYWKKYLKKE